MSTLIGRHRSNEQSASLLGQTERSPQRVATALGTSTPNRKDLFVRLLLEEAALLDTRIPEQLTADPRRQPIGKPSLCNAGRAWPSWRERTSRAPQRPCHGPLTATWTRAGRVPRWYAWWRLHDEQDGHCATCPGPAEVVDHDHTTGLLRGLLCYDCNHVEAYHAFALAVGLHSGDRCWFEAYWRQPPGARYGWYWPYKDRSTCASFLTHPPAWSAQPPPPVRCYSVCDRPIRQILAAGVHVARRGRPGLG
ncbi:endonuclease domain-containing protein [Streptomyces mirabilis]|uniref:endonuclease domain-containing protein n=1 Tax=Streptomyces mirabilis TaxID=68239 RepID=UPI0036AEB28B